MKVTIDWRSRHKRRLSAELDDIYAACKRQELVSESLRLCCDRLNKRITTLEHRQ